MTNLESIETQLNELIKNVDGLLLTKGQPENFDLEELINDLEHMRDSLAKIDNFKFVYYLSLNNHNSIRILTY